MSKTLTSNKTKLKQFIVYATLLTAFISIIVVILIYDKLNLLSNDEKEYIAAMEGIKLERHPGFWVLATPFYKLGGTLGVRLYNLILYLLASLAIYLSTTRRDKLLYLYIFTLNPFIMYFVPRILSEPSGYFFTIIALLILRFNAFLAGVAYGFALISKYYTIILFLLFIWLIYINGRIRNLFFFILGSLIPLTGMLLAGYVHSGNPLELVVRAGPELRVPLGERKHFLASALLAGTSPLLISLPYTIHLLRVIKRSRKLLISFTLIYINNFILGFFHLTGMSVWRYRDHIRLATVLIPAYSYITRDEEVPLSILTLEAVLALAMFWGLVALRIMTYRVL